jgi:hypothetical protein
MVCGAGKGIQVERAKFILKDSKPMFQFVLRKTRGGIPMIAAKRGLQKMQNERPVVCPQQSHGRRVFQEGFNGG